MFILCSLNFYFFLSLLVTFCMLAFKTFDSINNLKKKKICKEYNDKNLNLGQLKVFILMKLNY